MIKLNSDRLQVEIALPNEPPNNAFRFDRAGYITEVILDGKHWFCTTEPNNLTHPTTGGRGLCSEYCFDVSESVDIGNTYPKFGIGELKKTEPGAYCFYKKYECTPYPISWEKLDNQIIFTTEPLEGRPYSLRHIKRVIVEQNKLSMTIEVRNVGEKNIQMSEYCHNFISINGMSLGPGYIVEIPYITDRGTDLLDGTIKGRKRGFTFEKHNPKAAMVCIEKEEIERARKYAYTLLNTEDGAAVDVCESFRPGRIQLWAADHMVSVETFHEIDLAPGMSDSWMREWTFYEL